MEVHDRADKIEQLMDVTGVQNPDFAVRLLERSGWDLTVRQRCGLNCSGWLYLSTREVESRCWSEFCHSMCRDASVVALAAPPYQLVCCAWCVLSAIR